MVERTRTAIKLEYKDFIIFLFDNFVLVMMFGENEAVNEGR